MPQLARQPVSTYACLLPTAKFQVLEASLQSFPLMRTSSSSVVYTFEPSCNEMLMNSGKRAEPPPPTVLILLRMPYKLWESSLHNMNIRKTTKQPTRHKV